MKGEGILMQLKEERQNLLLVAHRGLSSEYPENTLIAFQAALQSNIDMLEIDLHRTADGCLVVIHDESIDRTSNGSEKIKAATLDALRQYDFGISKNSLFERQLIPTFEEVLQLIQSLPQTLLIEVKQPKNYPGIENDLFNKLEQYNINKDKVIIQSFDQNFIEVLYKKGFGCRLGVLISRKRYWYHMPKFRKISAYADFVNPHYSLVTKTFMKQAHQNGLKVMPYTVNDGNLARKLERLGVDGLISNNPNLLFH